MRTDNRTSKYIKETFYDLESQIREAQNSGYELTDKKILEDIGVLRDVTITFANKNKLAGWPVTSWPVNRQTGNRLTGKRN